VCARLVSSVISVFPQASVRVEDSFHSFVFAAKVLVTFWIWSVCLHLGQMGTSGVFNVHPLEALDC
jgi:hypothetical protein